MSYFYLYNNNIARPPISIHAYIVELNARRLKIYDATFGTCLVVVMLLEWVREKNKCLQIVSRRCDEFFHSKSLSKTMPSRAVSGIVFFLMMNGGRVMGIHFITFIWIGNVTVGKNMKKVQFRDVAALFASKAKNQHLLNFFEWSCFEEVPMEVEKKRWF